MGASNLLPRVITTEAIYEVCQYDYIFWKYGNKTEACHTTKQKNAAELVMGLEETENPFKWVNISPTTQIMEILSVAAV